MSFGGVAASRWLQKLSIKIRRRVGGGGGGVRWWGLCLTGHFYGSLIKLISCLVLGEGRGGGGGGCGGGWGGGGYEEFFCATRGSERSQALESVCRAKPHHLLEGGSKDGQPHPSCHISADERASPNFQKFKTAFFPHPPPFNLCSLEINYSGELPVCQ